MPTEPARSIQAPSPTPRTTLVVLAVTAMGFLLTSAPDLLAALGVIDETSLQAWMTLAGMLVGVPSMLLAVVAAGLTFKVVFRGSWDWRARLLAWWTIGAGSILLAEILRTSPTFNPYLGTPQPPFAASDAILLAGMVADIVLPLLWLRRR